MRIFLLTLAFFSLISCSTTETNKSSTETSEETSPSSLPPSHFHKQYRGTINGKLNIEMYLRRNGGEQVLGQYFYTSIGEMITLKGNTHEDGKIVLTEFTDGVTETGKFNGSWSDSTTFSGTWTDPTGKKSFPFELHESENYISWFNANLPFHPAYVDMLLNGDQEEIDLTSEFSVGEIQLDEDSSGYVYTDQEVLMREPFFRYSVIGYKGGNYFLDILYCGGGTGMFSSLYEFELEGNSLKKIREIAGGDRCNNGIESASLTKEKLIYSQSITMSDLLAYVEYNGDQVRNESCAMCCIGAVNMEFDLNTGKRKWESVNIDLTALEDVFQEPSASEQIVLDFFHSEGDEQNAAGLEKLNSLLKKAEH